MLSEMLSDFIPNAVKKNRYMFESMYNVKSATVIRSAHKS